MPDESCYRPECFDYLTRGRPPAVPGTILKVCEKVSDAYVRSTRAASIGVRTLRGDAVRIGGRSTYQMFLLLD